jgi:hypothetical protein
MLQNPVAGVILAPVTTPHVDVLIVGAGLSGIGPINAEELEFRSADSLVAQASLPAPHRRAVEACVVKW